ncbi:MAG: hypothetical protein EA382_19150, partial [Spirochaetaceae bacterium]
MKLVTRIGIALLTALLLFGCGRGPAHLTQSAGRAGRVLPTEEGTWFFSLSNVDVSNGVTFSVDVGTSPTDVALIFVNRTSSQVNPPSSIVSASVSGPILSAAPSESRSITATSFDESAERIALRGHPYVDAWEPPPLESTTTDDSGADGTARSFTAPPPPQFNLDPPEPGQTTSFTVINNDLSFATVEATLVSVIDDRDGLSGIALEMWVETAELDTASPPGPVTEGMVDDLSDRFVTTGGADDAIYDWV